MPISLFANYEVVVLKVARVVLLVIATITFLATIGIIAWLAFTWIKPAGTNYRDIMSVPVYEPIESAWQSTSSSGRTDEVIQTKLPPVMNETIATIDSLYQLVGREEPKFSERDDLEQFYTELVAPFDDFEKPNSYATEFLLDLTRFVKSMTEDELLKRIVDVDMRTTTIVDTIFKFRDDYEINLRGALATSADRSATHGRNKTLTSMVTLQVLSVCVTVFVVSTVCLLGFHMSMQRQGQVAPFNSMNANHENT